MTPLIKRKSIEDVTPGSEYHSSSIFEKIKFCIDINPKKIGKFLPSSLMSIRSKEDFFSIANEDDLLIISNPNYVREINADLASANLQNIEVFVL